MQPARHAGKRTACWREQKRGNDSAQSGGACRGRACAKDDHGLRGRFARSATRGPRLTLPALPAMTATKKTPAAPERQLAYRVAKIIPFWLRMQGAKACRAVTIVIRCISGCALDPLWAEE